MPFGDWFPVCLSPYEENQKGCSSDQPLLCPLGGPKMLIQVEWGWWVQILSKTWKFGYNYDFTARWRACLKKSVVEAYCSTFTAYYSIYNLFIKMFKPGSKFGKKGHLICWGAQHCKLVKKLSWMLHTAAACCISTAYISGQYFYIKNIHSVLRIWY